MNQRKPMDTNIETPKEKVATSVRIDANLHAVIAQLGADEGRPSQANMMERLLTTHPRVQEILEATALEATA